MPTKNANSPTMSKKDILTYWNGLTEGKSTAELWEALPYDLPEGSTAGACSISVSGPAAFIESVLFHLKPVTALDDAKNRLNIAMREIPEEIKNAKTGVVTKYPFGGPGKSSVRITLHERGTKGAFGGPRKPAVDVEAIKKQAATAAMLDLLMKMKAGAKIEDLLTEMLSA